MLAYTTLGVTDFERANAFYASSIQRHRRRPRHGQ